MQPLASIYKCCSSAKGMQQYTHNISFAQKPFEVVFLDVHQGGDIRDVEVVVFHMMGFQIDLQQNTWIRH